MKEHDLNFVSFWLNGSKSNENSNSINFINRVINKSSHQFLCLLNLPFSFEQNTFSPKSANSRRTKGHYAFTVSLSSKSLKSNYSGAMKTGKGKTEQLKDGELLTHCSPQWGSLFSGSQQQLHVVGTFGHFQKVSSTMQLLLNFNQL